MTHNLSPQPQLASCIPRCVHSQMREELPILWPWSQHPPWPWFFTQPRAGWQWDPQHGHRAAGTALGHVRMWLIWGLIHKKQYLIVVGINAGMGCKHGDTARHVRTWISPTGEERGGKSLQWGSSKTCEAGGSSSWIGLGFAFETIVFCCGETTLSWSQSAKIQSSFYYTHNLPVWFLYLLYAGW